MPKVKLANALAAMILLAIVASALLIYGGREIKDSKATAERRTGSTHSLTDLSEKWTLLSAVAGPRRSQEVASRIAKLRLVNYYPAANGWTKMWTSWNRNVLQRDFSRIHALGANAVRVVVFPNTFGWPKISNEMATHFAATLKMAASADLGVQVTLFDGWESYEEISQSQAWLRELLAPYASDPEIQLVELKNEVEPADAAEVTWVRALLPTLRSVMPFTPSTVSVASTVGPPGFVKLREDLIGVPLDVADMHFYGSAGSAYGWMLSAKHSAGTLPLFVGEIGFPAVSTNDDGIAAADLQQAHWFSVVFAAARAANISVPAPWILYDFGPGAIPRSEQSADASDFGLYSSTGKWRPSVSVVRQAFADRNFNTSNLDFSISGQNDMPAVWMPYLPSQGRLAYDAIVGHLKPGSVRLSDTRLSRRGAPSFSLVPTNPAISGQSWTVSVWAKGINVNGIAQLSLSWFSSNGSYLGETNSEPLPRGNPGWTELVIRTKVPSKATSVQLNVKSYNVTGNVWFDDVNISVTK